MSYPFNKSRRFFNCPPNCPERKPACQAHCRTYLDKKEEWDALMAAERKRKESCSYTIDCVLKNKDKEAKRKRDYHN